MDAAVIRQALEEKYLAPTRKERPLYSGIEVEMPILNLKKEAVDFELVHRTAERFMDICGFVPEKRDDEGEVILAADPVTGDSLSFDCSYNNIELSLGRAQDLQLAKIRFFHYYDVLQELFSAHDYTLTGMGVNPYRTGATACSFITCIRTRNIGLCPCTSTITPLSARFPAPRRSSWTSWTRISSRSSGLSPGWSPSRPCCFPIPSYWEKTTG